METYLHSLPDSVERSFKRDQVHDILRDLKPQLDTWGIVKIPVFNHNLTSQTHLSPYHNDLEALFGNQIDITKFM